MTLEEIKTAVRAGKGVYWKSSLYYVSLSYARLTGEEIWLVICRSNKHAIGLTHTDGVTMNGAPEDFHLIEPEAHPMDAVNTRIAAIMHDPAASDWLKRAITTLLGRDPLDAAEDARALHNLMLDRFKASL